ncbi:MAG TPA: carbonate dehydratase [Alcanivoracaceae bacterium]|nr:carbonate dehydratase [Alcanivoracaceae bacterium]
MNIKELIKRNHDWADHVAATKPDFFPKLAAQQKPEILWIGCSDSRVPANQVLDMDPGEVFVHRNVSNLIIHSDMNMLSTVQFAVEALRVKHIMIVGHYDCGGVKTALNNADNGLIDNWLLDIKDTIHQHQEELSQLATEKEVVNRVCELNVIKQVGNMCHTATVQHAWKRGQRLAVHGLCYGLHDGKVKDLEVTVDGPEKVAQLYRINL